MYLELKEIHLAAQVVARPRPHFLTHFVHTPLVYFSRVSVSLQYLLDTRYKANAEHICLGLLAHVFRTTKNNTELCIYT